MSDPNYWKRRYSGDSWSIASQREQDIINRINQETGLVVVPNGLGATSTDFLPGSAQSQGFERGGADLKIEQTSIYLEVTGPQSRAVDEHAPLWIRPDKIQNARMHLNDHEVWVIHWLQRNGLLRVIQLDDAFFKFLDGGAFPLVRPRIRGTVETYREIEPGHAVVRPWQVLIDRLRQL